MLEDDPLIDEPPQSEEIRGFQPENLASRSLVDDSLTDNSPIGYIAGRWDVPPWLLDEQPQSTKSTCIAHMFTAGMVIRMGHEFKLATYSHSTAEEKCRAIMSIPWHDADHKDTCLEQKELYHELCDKGPSSKCRYQKWKADGNDPALFRRESRRAMDGTEVPWKGGFFAGTDTLYPYAWEELLHY